MPGSELASVASPAAALRAALRAFDPGQLSGDECAALVRELASTERACAAARAQAAARVAAAGAHRASGFRDAADWLAAVTGSSAGEAKGALAVAASLDGCPVTRDALAAGDLSLAQAREITQTEAERPGSEAALVALARRSTLAALRDEARRRRFAAVDPEVLHARQHAARTVRHWRDEVGMVCGRFALPPEVGVPFVHRLDAATDRIRRRARRAGSCEERDAHAADAFVALFAGDDQDGAGGFAAAGDNGHGEHEGERDAGGAMGQGVAGGAGGRSRRGRRHPTADLVIVCDLRAWRRGHAHAGEPCHVVGGTPIPVRVARQLAGDAFLKAVTHDGKRIDTVVHWGRHIPAEVRTALELGAPPGFDGAVCVEPGCGRRHGLEWDHVDPVANRGPTSYANLAARCWPHHHDKTDRDRAAGRLGRARSGRATPAPALAGPIRHDGDGGGRCRRGRAASQRVELAPTPECRGPPVTTRIRTFPDTAAAEP